MKRKHEKFSAFCYRWYRFISKYKVTLLYSYLHVHSASQRHNIKDRRRNEGRMIKTHEGRHVKENAGSFFTTYLPLTLLQGFERLACERMLETERKLHILTPLLWPSRCVLFSWCWGPLHRGFPSAPSVGCGLPLPHLVSNPLGVCWQLLRGVARSPSVGCGLPYHISSLTLWESTGNCIGGFRGPPRSGVAFPTTYRLYCLEVCWQLHRGFPRSPSVRCGLPYHISSLTLWESAGNCIGGFRGPPRSGVAFPTTSRL